MKPRIVRRTGPHAVVRSIRWLGGLAALAAVAVAAVSLPGAFATRSAAPDPRPVAATSAYLHVILPSQTDPAIARPDEPHLAEPPSGPGNGLLLVDLGGSDSTPRNYTRLLNVAAGNGFHAIGLSYPDVGTIGTDCGSDLLCYGPVRQNIFDGAPAPRGKTDPANAVEHRLSALLRTLDRRFPDEGWEAFLRPDGSPAYDRIVFSGHSQGGAEAAYIGKVRRVAGVVMISSIVDSNASLNPIAPKRSAVWVTTGHITPLDRYTGLVHVDDLFVSSIRTNWTNLGLDRFGPALSIDGTGGPVSTHELLMTEPAANGLTAHLLPAADSTTPICPDGSPQLASVWSYLMLTAAGLPAPAPHAGC